MVLRAFELLLDRHPVHGDWRGSERVDDGLDGVGIAFVLAGAGDEAQTPGGGVVDQPGLGDVDVPPERLEESRRGGVFILADQVPLEVGPIADA